MPPTVVDVVIPALNEEASLPLVLGDLAALREPAPGGVEPAAPWLRRVVVADNGSTDGTARVAREAGAVVVEAPRPGYGSACLAGLEWLRANEPPEVVAFLDADYSDHPDELPRVVGPILDGTAELVIGSRVLGEREPGALLPQARAGNLVACWLIRLLYGHRFTDLGPFRAVSWAALERLGMADRDFGWTAEMQVKALRRGLRVAEAPVSYRRRVGVSKITGTFKGTVLAGWKILATVIRHSAGARPSRPLHHSGRQGGPVRGSPSEGRQTVRTGAALQGGPVRGAPSQGRQTARPTDHPGRASRECARADEAPADRHSHPKSRRHALEGRPTHRPGGESTPAPLAAEGNADD